MKGSLWSFREIVGRLGLLKECWNTSPLLIWYQKTFDYYYVIIRPRRLLLLFNGVLVEQGFFRFCTGMHQIILFWWIRLRLFETMGNTQSYVAPGGTLAMLCFICFVRETRITRDVCKQTGVIVRGIEEETGIIRTGWSQVKLFPPCLVWVNILS